MDFNNFSLEEKNIHMIHLTDAIIDGGVEGTRQAINYLRALRDFLSGVSEAPISISTKWDGAPAIFAGIDPADGKFFVAKKSIFNKSPKVYKTNGDIDADISGDLNDKMKLALAELPKLEIKDVIQGDFLYAQEDIKTVDIDGESYITFHPNTIVYAIPKKSKLADEIVRSKIGVVWHTVYRGDSLETMSASFGEKISGNLKKCKEIWSVDAIFKRGYDITMTETLAITELLSKAGYIFNRLERSVIDGLSDNRDLQKRINNFMNIKVRSGQKNGDAGLFIDNLICYIHEYYNKEASKKKTEKGKQLSYDKRDEVLSYFKKHGEEAINVFKMYNYIDEAKMMIISKLNNNNSVRTFLKTNIGYEATYHEGFVVIDSLCKNALKLVDRLNFSRANFSPEYIKGWSY